ncbi:hypothetical protein HMP06_1896 [Sphingomonas sp. HMP6]|nr:hypothetical protein HMP06_1896 [Sphingomonas sp. HMP6]
MALRVGIPPDPLVPVDVVKICPPQTEAVRDTIDDLAVIKIADIAVPELVQESFRPHPLLFAVPPGKPAAGQWFR